MQKMTPSDGQSMNVVDENIEVLKKAFPEAFTEDGIDFEVLRQLLGDNVAEGEEKYGLNWFGKKKARQIALSPSMGTLRPCPEESVDWDTTQNLFIEGDNLEVLKILQSSYANRVGMVYIDPPYNTGNEFIYPDQYTDNLDTYLRYTGQKDSNGIQKTSNSETGGRYHTNWLNMMYPRLKLARNVLSDDGVILVSISDHELGSLLFLMNEIYGEENRIAIFCWKSRAKPTNAGNAKFRPQKVSEYVVVYAKRLTDDRLFHAVPSKTRSYPHSDEHGNYRTTTILTSNRGTFRRETMRFEAGGFSPDEDYRWKAGKQKIDYLFDRERIVFTEDGIPMEKKYEHEEAEPLYPIYTFVDNEISGTAESGKSDLNSLVGNRHGLDTVKPVQLLKYLVTTFSSPSDIILDFFSGSCTTAQSILELNIEQDSHRRYIVVQLPEKIDKTSEAYRSGFYTIADIGKQRIRNFNKQYAQKVKQDLGMKIFKLYSSNIKIWSAPCDDLDQYLLDNSEHVASGRTKQDVLYELLLKRGIDLAAPIDKIVVAGKTVFSVGFGALFACLDELIKKEEIEVELPPLNRTLGGCR